MAQADAFSGRESELNVIVGTRMLPTFLTRGQAPPARHTDLPTPVETFRPRGKQAHPL